MQSMAPMDTASALIALTFVVPVSSMAVTRMKPAPRAGAVVYTDEAAGYRNLTAYRHEAVRHAVGEYVRGRAHTNGIESFWSLLKRAYAGTFHHLSPKHLQRYVNEFAGRKGIRELDTISQMGTIATGLVGRRLMYRDLIG